MRPHAPRKNDKHHQRTLRRLESELHARLFQLNDGRVLLVRGTPDPQRLLRNLAHAGVLSLDQLTPRQLGFSADQIEPLTTALLTRLAHQLRRRELAAQRRGRGVGRRQVGELRRARRRLDSMYACLNRPAPAGHAAGLLLDADQRDDFAATLRSAGCYQAVSADLPRIARMVYWLGGRPAVHRFVTAHRRLPVTTPESRARDQLRTTLAQLLVWQKRLEREWQANIRAEVVEWARRLPPTIATRAGLLGKKWSRSHATRLQAQVDSCRQALRECDDGCRSAQVAAIAALSIRGETPLPSRLLSEWGTLDDRNRMMRTAAALLDQSSKPGYRRVLAYLEANDEVSSYDLDCLRRLLARGEKMDDVRWAYELDLTDEMNDGGIRINWFRRLVQDADACGMSIGSELFLVADACKQPLARVAIRGFVDWVGRLPDEARSPRVVRQLRATLTGPLLWAVSRPRLFAPLRDWLRRASLPRGVRFDQPEVWTSLRQSCSIEPDLVAERAPGSDVAQELRYLAARVESGQATAGQRLRLSRLADRRLRGGEAGGRRGKSVCRAAVTVANEALLRTIRDGAQDALGPELGELVDGLPLQRCLEFVKWKSEMDTVQRRLLQGVLAAHARHGRDYKLGLDCNRQWVREARTLGMAVRQWARPAEHAVALASGRATIGGCDSLLDVLLMGTRFQTCLSLDGCNNQSVLTNAAHANKQVIYARDAHGRPIARKLLAVSRQWTVLGYECYVTGVRSRHRDEVVAAVDAYCLRLAEAIGLPLASTGAPASLSGCFWYDDGPVEWRVPAPDAGARPAVPAAHPVVDVPPAALVQQE